MIDWSKQHCGVHQAPYAQVLELMPDLAAVLLSFPERGIDFTWDVKVHMLMPRQYPCIQGWHVDNVPRATDGRQMFDQVRPDLPMWMWVSGGPLTQFRAGYVLPEKWIRFTQQDEHRGQAASEFCWRGFIRATHRDIMPPKASDWKRRHCQVYVPEVDYQW
jgi:hypothetical protein